MTPTLEQQIACVRRELRMREFVYPNRVRAGRMRQASADEEITCMQAVLETLRQAQLAAAMDLFRT